MSIPILRLQDLLTRDVVHCPTLAQPEDLAKAQATLPKQLPNAGLGEEGEPSVIRVHDVCEKSVRSSSN